VILSLFKSKPKLRDLIPEGFVDIHSHILPGIDDGAKNIEESIKLIDKMEEMGFAKIIGTPHIYPGLYDNTNESIKKSFNKIQNKKSTIDYASEYMIDLSLIKSAEKKSLLTLNENYVLIESSLIYPSKHIYEIIFQLRINGYIPILAHPERYTYYTNDFNEFYKLKRAGCLFQINLLSTTGYYGSPTTKLAKKLLKKKLIDFAGTDIHNINHVNNFGKKVIVGEPEYITKLMDRNQIFI